VLDSSPVHPDHPSTTDRLARKGFARALAVRLGRIWNEYARLPGVRQRRRDSGSPNSFILHLHGPWGSGKSSLLAMLRSALQPESRESRATSRWIVVDFNAWAHQRLPAPWWQLLDGLYRQAVDQLGRVYRHPGRALWLRITEWWWRFFTLRRDTVFAGAAAVFLTSLLYWAFSTTSLFERLFTPSEGGVAVDGGSPENAQGASERDSPVAEAVDLLALLGTLLSAAVVIGRSLIFGGVRSAQQFIESSADPMARITAHFGEMLWRIDRPVAIFIDDLDRCQEEYVIRLLEGIQTLFNDPRVVYIIAADRRWLHACYENTYARFQGQVHEPGRSLGTLFLEKIFQLSVTVPRLSPEVQQDYWRYLVHGRDVDIEKRLEEARESARGEFATARSEATVFSRLTEPDAGEDPVRTQARREAAVERLASERVEKTTIYFLEEFSHLLEPNPRAMKRLLNAYAVHRDLAILSGLNVLIDVKRRKQLALWTILSLRWPLLSDYLIDRVEGRSPEPDEAVRELAATNEVQSVLAGEGVSATLDFDTIRVLVGIAVREGGTSAAIA
jgi:energy-coupling factor transporter ATP-binding protein EcfA2